MLMVLRGILVSLHYCMIVQWCLPLYCIYNLYTVYTLHVLTLSHWFYVYRTYSLHLVFTDTLYIIWYSLHQYSPLSYNIMAIYIYSPGIQLVYNMYTSGFIFKGCLIRPSYIYAFSSITFSYCPSRLRMLAGSSTPPWGLARLVNNIVL